MKLAIKNIDSYRGSVIAMQILFALLLGYQVYLIVSLRNQLNSQVDALSAQQIQHAPHSNLELYHQATQRYQDAVNYQAPDEYIAPAFRVPPRGVSATGQ